MTSRVFITQKPMYRDRDTGEFIDKFDLEPARKFGEIVEVLPPGNLKINCDSINDIWDKLSDFSEDDFLLNIGDPLAMVTVACIACEKTSGSLRMLRWDRYRGAYAVVSMNLNRERLSADIFHGG